MRLEPTDDELQNRHTLLHAGGNPGAVIVMLVSLFQDVATIHPATAREVGAREDEWERFRR
jgi:hypothetical protein